MPAFYAHQRFGNDVFRQLPEAYQTLINKEKDLFNIGLQGPDPFFYFRPLTKNPVTRLGSKLHHLSGRQFFGKLIPYNEPEKVYLTGVLCHFMLDSTCHGYVWAKTKEGPASHEEIESDFERFLLERDGKEPASTKVTGDFHPSVRSAKAMAAVYSEAIPAISWPLVEDDLGDVVLFQNFLLCPGEAKRKSLMALFRLMKIDRSVGGHIVKNEPDPACGESSEELMKRYETALEKAVPFVEAYLDTADTEAICAMLTNEKFTCDFEGEVHDHAGSV